MSIKLWKHQQEVIELAKTINYLLLAHEPGTGKTISTSMIMQYVYQLRGGIQNTIILCPIIVLNNWKAEIAIVNPALAERVIILKGTGKKKAEQVRSAPPGSIIILNYESMAVCDELLSALLKFQPLILIADESQRLKCHSTRRTKATILLSKIAQYRYLLSGTMAGDARDLFSQTLIADGGQRLGTNFYSFMAKYFVDLNKDKNFFKGKRFPDYQLRPGALEHINKLISDCLSVAKKSECLDLPELLIQNINYDLSPKAQKAYDSMLKDFVAVLDDETIQAALVLTQLMKLAQIVTGYANNENGQPIKICDGRQKVLEDLLESIPRTEQVIVWSIFRQNYEDIKEVCEKLSISYCECIGGMSTQRQLEAVEAFTRGDYRVLIGHPRSLGVGINLVTASYCIYYSKGFSLEDYEQSQARNYRGGSEIHNRITQYHLIANGTIETKISESLINKQAIGAELLKTWRKDL